MTRSYLLRVSFLLITFFVSVVSKGQYITSIIGNGISSCYQDNKPPLCLPVFYPHSACVAPNNDIFFVCGNSIKKLSDSSGLVVRIAGTDTWAGTGDGGPAADALFQFARAIKMDKKGDIYIAELSGHRIRKIDMSTGIVTRYAGNSSAGYSGDGGLAVNAQINRPWDIAIDDNGNLFIADFDNSRIRKVHSATGVITTYAGNGTYGSTGDGGLAVNASIQDPSSICVDAQGNVYFTEIGPGSNRLRKIDAATGIITTLAGNGSRAHGGDGGLAVNASLIEPSGVAIDALGNIYVAEYVDSRLRKIDASTGIINTIAGTGVNGFSGDGGLAINAQLDSPLGLSFDNKGNLLICDSRTLRIRKLHIGVPPSQEPGPAASPVVRIASPTTTICNSSSITFTATPYFEVAGSWFVWTKNGQVVGTDSLQWTASGLQPGDVVMCAMHFPDCIGTTKVLSNAITVSGTQPQALAVTVSTNRTMLCKNDTVTFNAAVLNGGSSLTYRWKLNNIDVGPNSAVFRTSTLSDGDLVSCDVEQAAVPPCSPKLTARSNIVSISIRSPLVPIVSITASSDSVCVGSEVTFKAVAQNADTSFLFQWKLNGIPVASNGQSYTSRSLKNNDEVGLIVEDKYGCILPVSSNIVSMYVEEPPKIEITPADTLVTVGSSVLIRATMTGDVSSYVWRPSAALINSNTLTPATIPLQKKTVLILSAYSTLGCVDSASSIINVQQKLFMPNAFTPNGDAKNDFYRIPLNTTIELKNFSIYNMWGERIFSTSNINDGWDGKVKGIVQNSGTYIYVVTGSDSDGPVYVRGTFSLIR